jgi:hypothetical protein
LADRRITTASRVPVLLGSFSNRRDGRPLS